MSYCWTGVAVRAPEADVRAALDAFARARGGRVVRPAQHPEGRGSIGYFRVVVRGDWTLIGFTEVCIYPSLSVDLSVRLRTRTLTIGEFEVIGLQHYSVVDEGRARVVFSYLDDVIDSIHMDLPALIQLARDDPNGTIRFPPRTFESDYPFLVYGVLKNVVGELPMEEMLHELSDVSLAGVDLLPSAELRVPAAERRGTIAQLRGDRRADGHGVALAG